jgi:hypothetical protein
VPRPTAREIDHRAGEAVRLFLRLYGKGNSTVTPQ